MMKKITGLFKIFNRKVPQEKKEASSLKKNWEDTPIFPNKSQSRLNDLIFSKEN